MATGVAARSVVSGLRCVSPVFLLLVLWELASLWIGSDLLPDAFDVAKLWVTHALADPVIRSQGGGEHGFLPHVLITLARVAGGATMGVIAGAAVAAATFQWQASHRSVELLVEVTRVVPPLILIPFVLIAIGPTELAQVTVCALYTALSMLVHTLNALGNIPREYWIIARLQGATRWQASWTVALPASLPELLGGVRISLALALGIVIVSEYLGAPDGIGRVLKFALSFARTDLMVVGLLWATLIGLFFDRLASKAIHARNRWRRGS